MERDEIANASNFIEQVDTAGGVSQYARKHVDLTFHVLKQEQAALEQEIKEISLEEKVLQEKLARLN
jgi:putative IMPACT (imprinted ancient) family translation regulator